MKQNELSKTFFYDLKLKITFWSLNLYKHISALQGLILSERT